MTDRTGLKQAGKMAKDIHVALSFPVSPAKLDNLRQRMKCLGLREADINESFFRTSGPGGQKSQKASTGVAILHRPTGIRVRCQRERSQGLNRFLARRLLVEELEARTRGKTRHQVKAENLRELKHDRAATGKTAALKNVRHLVYEQFFLRPLPPPATPGKAKT